MKLAICLLVCTDANQTAIIHRQGCVYTGPKAQFNFKNFLLFYCGVSAMHFFMFKLRHTGK